ncbi:hypothetical protein C6H66_21600 [Photorhabdus hindustanensis]|uniref:Uncharacterized protein n=1 Tax=Photorhabdus hindustanensis TaxID=2918802 RepID=A0A2S8PVH9_9GAMM|nr:hypothetical protein C6H66_21600 [Photorhabdus hindustanensis]
MGKIQLDKIDGSIAFYSPGKYSLEFYVEGESYDIGGIHLGSCASSRKQYYWTIDEPSYSGVTFTVKDQASGREGIISKSNSIYDVPYAQKKLVLQPNPSERNKEINKIASCTYALGPTKTGEIADKTKVLIDGAHGSGVIDPLLIKPGITLTVSAFCKLKGKGDAYPGYEKEVTQTIKFHRNQARFGNPHYTLSVAKDGKTTQPPTPDKVTPIDWQSNVKYTIGVGFDQTQLVKPETCDYDNTHIDARENMLTRDAKDKTKNYSSYKFSQYYHGSCYIGGRDDKKDKNDSPYKYFPHQEVINNSFTLIRNAPRIVTENSFKGSGFGTATPDGETTKLRPGDKVNVKVTAHLQGDYPNVKVSLINADSNLSSQSCHDDSDHSSSPDCQLSIEPDSSKSIEWVLTADKTLMGSTTASLSMSGSNHELEAESGQLKDFDFVSKKITITPVITLAGQLNALDEAALAKKVYHYGREFSVAMEYRLLGKTPQGTPNTAYKGNLVGLKVQPNNGLVADAASSARITVGETPATVNPGWKGDSSQQLISGQTALEHDQVIHLQVPVKVASKTRGTANIEVLGGFIPTNVDIAPGSTLQSQSLLITLGDELLPAENVYYATVNGDKPLVVSKDTRNQVLTVKFGSKLKADKLMTPAISGTEMTVTLPKELSRSRDGDQQLVLLCDGEGCSQEYLDNGWDGERTTTVLKSFMLNPKVEYLLRIPVTLKENIVSVANSQVRVSLTQSQTQIGQDTAERVVTWVDNGTPSTLVVNKALKLETQGPVSILPLDVGDEQKAGSAILHDEHSFSLSVKIVNAADKDKVTLMVGNKPVDMHRSGLVNKDGAVYVAENLPIPNKPDYPLSIQYQSATGAVLTKWLTGSESRYAEDPRNLTCKKQNNIMMCTLYWGGNLGVPVPYTAGDAVLSIEALNSKGLLHGITLVDLMDGLSDMNARIKNWNGAVLFKTQGGQSAVAPPNFRPTDNKESSIMETGKGPLPIKGQYQFGD